MTNENLLKLPNKSGTPYWISVKDVLYATLSREGDGYYVEIIFQGGIRLELDEWFSTEKEEGEAEKELNNIVKFINQYRSVIG